MPTQTQTSDQLRSLIAEELPELIAIRHDLHAHPELGYDETRTSGVVQRELEAAGVEYKPGLAGGTGVLGHLPGADDEAVGLRADMDALPITEETTAEYASRTPGTMHACGHDGHTTILIGTARVLAKLARADTLPRPVSFVFQPAEEGGFGGRRMVEDGCLDGRVLGPPIASMFGLHGWPQYPLGVVGTRPGPMLAAADMFEIEIRGRGAHAAFPHAGHDPILAGSAVVTALQSVASRNVDPLEPIVVSVTQFHGGTTHNVIPEAIKLTGTVRTLSRATQKLAIARMTEISEEIAKGHGCHAEVNYTIGYPATVNDGVAAAVFNETARAALGDERVVDVPQPFMGGEDFAFYCQKVPSCFFALGLLPPGAESMPKLHQPNFDFNDDAIATGIEVFCRLALRA